MKIYIDMDDVVADWIGFARDFFKNPDLGTPGTIIPQEDWNKLVKEQRMYRDLKVRHDAKSLIAWLNWYKTVHTDDVELFFLTAVPHNNDMPYAFMDKVNWAQKHFPNIPVFFGPYSHDKYIHCKPGDILIDDRTSNCEEWRREGGLAHEFVAGLNASPG